MSSVLAESLPQVGSAAACYYDEYGYVVFPGLIPASQIDELVDLYREQIVPSRNKFFRQSTDHYEVNRLTRYGHVVQSFLDIHAYESFAAFREAALKIYFSPQMRSALTETTGSDAHRMMQSMLFDMNAETWPHQDWWYLDSVPNGGLLGAWIALEDIAQEAGRFYVLPRSQQTILHNGGISHSKWVERMRAHIKEHRAELHAPALRKGDVLLWNSRTIHGSLPTVDERYSRKSLTAHYLPSGMTFGNLFTAKPWINYASWHGHEYFVNQPEYSLTADVASRAKHALYDRPALLKLARKLQRKTIADLNR